MASDSLLNYNAKRKTYYYRDIKTLIHTIDNPLVGPLHVLSILSLRSRSQSSPLRISILRMFLKETF